MHNVMLIEMLLAQLSVHRNLNVLGGLTKSNVGQVRVYKPYVTLVQLIAHPLNPAPNPYLQFRRLHSEFEPFQISLRSLAVFSLDRTAYLFLQPSSATLLYICIMNYIRNK